MISLRDIAAAHRANKIPVVFAKNVKTSKGQVHNALVIELEIEPADSSIETQGPSQVTEETLLANEDMIELDDVVKLVGASGRSSVYAMEASNRIFGVLPLGRIRGKRYPRWQFLPAIIGQPLQRILAELRPMDSWAKYQFFISSYPQLGNLTPIEALTGDVRQSENLSEETEALLKAPSAQRVNLVVDLAKGFANPS